MVTDSLAHKLITTHAPVRDVWRVLHPDCSLGAGVDDAEKARNRQMPTAEFNVVENGATCDSVFNTWRWNQLNDTQPKQPKPGEPVVEIPGDTIDPRAKRLDYIFANTYFDPSNPGKGGWIVKSAKVGMMFRHPVLHCSLSDHFSVETTLVRYKSSGVEHLKDDVDNGAYLLSPTASEHSNRLPPQLNSATDAPYLPISTYDEILAMIHQYRHRERLQRRLRLGHFAVELLISIGCLVAVWWSPRNFVAFILMFVSTFGLSAGVIDGLIGGLFVGSEIRALKEFEWEISNAKAAALGEPHSMDSEGIKDW